MITLTAIDPFSSQTRRATAAVPNCLILDVTLPDLNGLDLQRRVAADRSDMPVIFITASGDVRTSVQAMKAGALDS